MAPNIYWQTDQLASFTCHAHLHYGHHLSICCVGILGVSTSPNSWHRIDGNNVACKITDIGVLYLNWKLL